MPIPLLVMKLTHPALALTQGHCDRDIGDHPWSGVRLMLMENLSSNYLLF